MCNNSKFCVGVLIGAAVGAAINCFLHSEKGKVMMHDMCESAKDMEFKAKMMAEKAKDKMYKMNDNIKEHIQEETERV